MRLAVHGWKHDPIFMPYFHPTGCVLSGISPECLAHLKLHDGVDGPEFEPLTTADDFRKTMPAGVLTGEFPNWKGWYRRSGSGWVHARKAMESAAREAERLGVTFIAGSPEGAVSALIYEDGDVIGARTADGKEHRAARVILAAGANADQLFDFKDQLRPTAWTLSHIKMTDEERKLYRNLPVLFNIEKGFFMEPDEDRGELKICDEHPGYCNWVDQSDGTRKNVPFSKHQIPLDAEARARDFLRDTMPHLASRPFVFARICWDADTPDRAFLIDRHPEYFSLVVAVGGCGHGFMNIPSIGGLIVDEMEGTLDERMGDAFRWRPEQAIDRNWEDTQGRFGAGNKVMDFQKVEGWTQIIAPR